MAARTAFFDRQTVAAIAASIPQVVIIGAGYDGRALRFADPGVRFFEVDHPSTQPDKARRLARVAADMSRLELVPVDLLTDDLVAALAARGHDVAQPSLFICEGVLAYLPADVIERLFTSVRKLAAPGSMFATNFFIRPADAPRRAFLSRTTVDALLRVIGERRMSAFRPGDPERLLAAAGWRVVEQLEGEREGAGYVALVAATPA
jgi:methyltransferase (TIGR00027 family)